MLDMITVGYKSTKMGFGSCIACINALLMCRRTWGYANGSKWSHFQESMVYCVHECFMFEHSHRTSNQPTSSNIGIWTNIIWRTLVSRNPRIGIPYVLVVGLQIPLVEPLLWTIWKSWDHHPIQQVRAKHAKGSVVTRWNDSRCS